MSGRYALYFTPAPNSLLDRFGARWFGDETGTGRTPDRSLLGSISPERHGEITASARHYGFHATLKAPFALAKGSTPDQLESALATFADGRATVTDVRLNVGVLDGFIALVPTEGAGALQKLAADCVRVFDPFRAPPSEEDLARRRQAPLSEIQDVLLQRWGYPYVMEAFRFHMTLTCRLKGMECSQLESSLRKGFEPFAGESIALDAISLCHQETRTSPFHLLRRYPFTGAASLSN